MRLLFASKVGRGFFTICLLLWLPLIVVAWFQLRSATWALEEQTHWVLRAASDGAEAQLREFLVTLRCVTESVSTDPRLLASVTAGNRVELGEIFRQLKKAVPDALRIFYLNDQGKVVASSDGQRIGKDESALQVFRKGMRAFYPGDVVRDRDTGRLRWWMSAPVKQGDAVEGVVAIAVDPAALSSMMTGRRVLNEGADTQSFRIGPTGESYLVNKDGYMITESRYVSDAILRVKVDTKPVRIRDESSREMMGDYQDYRGVPVSGASSMLGEMNWLLLTEIDFTQVFAPVAAFRKLLIVIIVMVGILALVVATRLARGIVGPIQLLTEADQAFLRNDMKAAYCPEDDLPANELGEFARRRNERLKILENRQRELAEEQQARAQTREELDRISYSMVHEMRGPLRAITGFAELLSAREAGSGSADQRDYLDRIKSASRRMDHLVCDVLKYCEIVRGELAVTKIDVLALVQKIIEEDPQLRAHKEAIHIGTGLPLVMANEAALHYCFGALLDNAVRYRKPNGPLRVDVTGERHGDTVRLLVEDNGVGMPAELQRRAFEIFQRGTRNEGGTGIGLALVHSMVRGMGGRVGLSSQPEVGTRVWIDLKTAGTPG